MKKHFCICLVSTVVFLIPAGLKSGDDKDIESKLKSDDSGIHLEAVKDLVSEMPDKGIREILITHYGSLPKKRNTGTKKAEMAREMIVETVARDKSPESEKFLADVLDEEYGNVLREQEKGDVGNLPCLVRDSATQLVARYYSDSEILKQTVNKWLSIDLGFNFKRDLTAVKIVFDMKQNGLNNIQDQVKYLADKIIPGPLTPIPEDIYLDKDKRIAYGKTDKCQKEDEYVGNYFRSKEGITEYGLEIALEHLGREAVESIIDYVKNNKPDRAKADQLMIIASEIMADHIRVNKKLSEQDKKVIDEIQKYVEGMENQGVFDREDRVRGNLNRIKEFLK